MKIMSDNKYKTWSKNLLNNGIYLFMYDIKTTKPDKFSDPNIFHIAIFQIGTSVALKV